MYVYIYIFYSHPIPLYSPETDAQHLHLGHGLAQLHLAQQVWHQVADLARDNELKQWFPAETIGKP